MTSTALNTYPLSYSEVCDTFRPRLATARRTDSGTTGFVHFLKRSSVRNRFVAEHVAEGRPANIINRLRHASFDEPHSRDIPDRYVIELFNKPRRELVQIVFPAVSDLGVNSSGLPFLSRTLGLTESRFQGSVTARILDFFASGECGELFQAEINTDDCMARPNSGIGQFDGQIDHPYRMEDCVLFKFNIRKSRPRKKLINRGEPG